LAALVVELRAENAALRKRVEELERQVNRNSGNSSMPPSQEPPLSRAERRRRAREAYKRSMRKSGGQPGSSGQ
jgi:transposase